MIYVFERRSKDMEQNKFKKQYLGSGINVFVSDEHTFGTDAMLLADFAKIKPRDIPMDMGTGCGIIPLIWCKNEALKQVHCLDIQEQAVEQVRQAIDLNSLENRLFVHHCDLREIRKHFDAESFTAVTMNPPYKPLSTGIESSSASDKIARHETMCSLDDAVKAGAFLLKFGGRMCMCHRPERLTDILCCMRANNLEPKVVRFVCDKEGKEPFLVLVQARKGGKSGVRVKSQLVLRKPNGDFTDEVFEIYGSYSEGYKR